VIKLKVLDLFSGIGGFSLGLERTGGFETVRFCEMKPHARAVLEKNFGGIPCHDDVTTMEFKEGEADVITAGFPCQDISFAGDGAGLAGARSGLYREVIRAIRVVRPLRAVLENVAALLSRGLGTVLGDLATVGYDAEWHCIPASAVGAPHRRDRIWIIADARSEQHEGGSTPLSGALAAQLPGVYSDPESERCFEAGQLRHEQSSERSTGLCQEVANFNFIDVQRLVSGVSNQKEREGQERGQAGSRSDGDGWWSVEPDVGRVAHGVPARVDRLAELGNAVVPQIPEIIGRAILYSRARA
jgi:DNA (cytosine-5)-methyltransferase 1